MRADECVIAIAIAINYSYTYGMSEKKTTHSLPLFYTRTVRNQSNYCSSVLRFVECVNSSTVLLKIRAHVAL